MVLIRVTPEPEPSLQSFARRRSRHPVRLSHCWKERRWSLPGSYGTPHSEIESLPASILRFSWTAGKSYHVDRRQRKSCGRFPRRDGHLQSYPDRNANIGPRKSFATESKTKVIRDFC